MSRPRQRLADLADAPQLSKLMRDPILELFPSYYDARQTLPGPGRTTIARIEYDVFLADCPARTTLSLVADTWSVVVVFALGEGPRRYADLQGRIGGISKKMLTQTLRKLERNGLVERRHIRSAPPGVEYRLTELGTTLLEPVRALSQWAERHTGALLDAQAAA